MSASANLSRMCAEAAYESLCRYLGLTHQPGRARNLGAAMQQHTAQRDQTRRRRLERHVEADGPDARADRRSRVVTPAHLQERQRAQLPIEGGAERWRRRGDHEVTKDRVDAVCGALLASELQSGGAPP